MSRVLRTVKKLLGRSRVIWLALLAAAVFFTAGFAELAFTRHSMQKQYEEALARVERTERQNVLLQLELERAQRHELLPWQAWEMFGRLPKGVNGVQAVEPQVIEPAGPVEPAGPRWRSWLRALGIN